MYLSAPTVRKLSSKASLSHVSNAGLKVITAISDVARAVVEDTEGANGVAIVAACRNRQETLANVLPTWLAVEGVDEIVIVDWDSDPPLRSVVRPERDPRLRLVRVNNEPLWVLSRAYNLALNTTTANYVIRTDCDYSLDSELLDAHPLNKTEAGFYSGNWVLARDENEVHLNGAIIIKRELFWSVGGYDERIQTYGWDDGELYTRLSANNVEKLNISYDYIRHIAHEDSSRAQRGVKFAQVQIDLNQLLLEKLPAWSMKFIDDAESSKYKTLTNNGDSYRELEATYIPKALKELVEEDVYEEAWATALGRRLADDYHVPWDLLQAIDSDNKELMLRSLVDLRNGFNFEKEERKKGKQTVVEGLRTPTEARIVLVHCMHGLGNRLRALGSAFAFAKNAQRVPVVLWESDAHIAAEFDELFNASNIVLAKKLVPQWPFEDLDKYDASWKYFKFYNYMDVEKGAVKGELIENEPDKHIYYKGAYIMEAPEYTWWEADNEELRKLEPIGLVQENLDKLEQEGLSSAIGVHIRNRTLDADIKGVDVIAEYGSEAAKIIEHWRIQSSYTAFVGEMDRIIEEEDKNAMFYVATDTWDVISIMEEKFPGRILSTPRNCDDRDSECVKYAVIDMYALSKTKKLLGSNWSSYTEMAERLGGLKARLAGRDFGRTKAEAKEGKY